MGRGFSGANKSASGGLGTKIMVSMGTVLLLVTLLAGFCLYTFLAQLPGGRPPSPTAPAADPAVQKLTTLLKDLRAQEQLFLRDQTPVSVVQFDAIGKNLLAEAMNLEKRAKQANDLRTAPAAAQITQMVSGYLACFRELVQAWEIKGVSEGSGIRQKIREAAQNISPLAAPAQKDQVLQDTLAKLVRAEQNYFAARSVESRELLGAAVTDMTGAIAASGLAAAEQEALRTAVKNYITAFDRYQAVALNTSDPSLSAAFAAEQVKQEKAMHQATLAMKTLIDGRSTPGPAGTIQDLSRQEQEYLRQPDAGHADRVAATLVEYEARLDAAPLAPEQKAAMKKAVAAYRAAFASLVDQDKKIAAATAGVNTAFAALQNQLSSLVAKGAPPAPAKGTLLPALPPRISLLIIVGGWLGIVLLGLLVARLLAGSIRKPLRRMTDTARLLAVQDVTGEGFPPEKNEYGVLVSALNDLLRRRSAPAIDRPAVIADLSVKAEDLARLVRQKIDHDDRIIGVAARLVNTLSGLRELVDRLQRVSEEVHTATAGTAGDTRQVQETATACELAVTTAVESLQNLIQAGGRLNATITANADLAEQTSVTALNAAIKATRAGIHGKEFSEVTADLDRLAKRSGETAKEISQLLANLDEGLTAGRNNSEEARLALQQLTMATAAGPGDRGPLGESFAALQAEAKDSAALLTELGDSSSQLSSLLAELAQLNQEVEVALLRVEPLPPDAAPPPRESAAQGDQP